ncbi:MAG: TIGR04211 family SH3 domain-containing protein [Desulfuromonadaceae bacterium]|nr:TIGR04211 family SH3 domain-containing protein [Desulfuromonadaceae bacterium]
MRIIVFFCFALVISVFAVVSAGAETRYVSDQIAVTLRRGPGTEFKILKSLTTGSAVEFLEEEDGYLKVRAKNGDEGYVLKQYISAQLPKTYIIARLEKKVTGLQQQLATMAQQAEGWTGEKKELQQQLADVQQALNSEKGQHGRLAKQHQVLQDGAKNVAELLDERDRLKAENEKYAADLAQLRQDNDDILRKAIVKWFLAGAGVLLLGWLMGKQSRTRKRAF